MSQTNREPSATEIASRRKAKKAKQSTLIFSGLTVIVLLVAVGVWGYRNGWFESRPPAPTMSVDDERPTPVAGPPRVYPVRNFAFICEVSTATRPRVAKFLHDALPSFGNKQAVDVMVLAENSGFTSETGGCVEMTAPVRGKVCDLVAAAPEVAQASAKTAILRALDEHAEAIYFLTPTNAITEFGPDPVQGLKQMTGDRLVPINCVVFLTPTDSPEQLQLFKTLAKATRGEYSLSK